MFLYRRYIVQKIKIKLKIEGVIKVLNSVRKNGKDRTQNKSSSQKRKRTQALWASSP